jgi:hypothetical protein
MKLATARTAQAGDPDVRALSLASGVGRLAIGLGIFLAPDRALRALGFHDLDTAGTTLARLAGARDLVLAGSTLAALADAGRLRAASLANAAADGGDVVSFALALRRADSGSAPLRGLAAALPATAAGLWVAWRLSGMPRG